MRLDGCLPINFALSVVCCVLCVVFCVLCVVCCVLCVVFCVLCIVCCVLCDVCCVLCVVFCVFCVSLSHLRNLLQSEHAPDDAFLFLNAMIAFIEVHRRCFGLVLRTFASQLTELRRTILLLPIKKLPLKLHVVTAHLKQRCVCVWRFVKF